MTPCFRQITRTSYDRNCRQPEARIGNVPRTGNSMDTNLIIRKNIVISGDRLLVILRDF